LIIKELLINIIGKQKLYFIEQNKTAYEAARSMLKYKCGALLVCNDTDAQDLTGIITERDLAFRIIPQNLKPSETKISSIMTKKVDTILDTKTTFDAIGMMKKKGYRHLPVISNKKVVGILSMRDLYAEANNQLQDSLKQHKDFLFGTGYGG
tara:strand:- start:230 stop:685 length:456 start_codon:yes stop_codon:yes gene_type:complete